MSSRLTLTLTAALIPFLSLPAISYADDDPTRGKKVFARCISCHEVERPRSKMGPHLQNLLGRQAGSIEGFKYSQAMVDAGTSGLIWDEANLKEFIAKPKALVPGTSMRFFGLWSESDINDVIAYLKTQTGEEQNSPEQ